MNPKKKQAQAVYMQYHPRRTQYREYIIDLHFVMPAIVVRKIQAPTRLYLLNT